MKLETQIAIAITSLLAFSAFSTTTFADTVNKKKVLKKAGGNVDGEFTDVVITTIPHDMSPPIVETSFDRSGSIKLPKKKGSASATVVHEGPEREFDSTSSGNVNKAKVNRSGKKVKYTGSGEITPIFDSDSNYSGSVQASSKIKGKKVMPKGSVSGSRVLMNGDTENVTGNLSGEGKF